MNEILFLWTIEMDRLLVVATEINYRTLKIAEKRSRLRNRGNRGEFQAGLILENINDFMHV